MKGYEFEVAETSLKFFVFFLSLSLHVDDMQRKENIQCLITLFSKVWLPVYHKPAQFSCAEVSSVPTGPLQSHTIFFSQTTFNSLMISRKRARYKQFEITLWKNADLFKYEQIFIWPAGRLKLLSISSAGPWLFVYVHHFVIRECQHNWFQSASVLLNLILVSHQRWLCKTIRLHYCP